MGRPKRIEKDDAGNDVVLNSPEEAAELCRLFPDGAVRLRLQEQARGLARRKASRRNPDRRASA